MKYLLEARTVEVINTVKEICYDLTDAGFNYIIHSNANKNHLFINKIGNHVGVSNFYNTKPFIFDEVKDVIFRIKDYLGKNFISMDINTGKHLVVKNFDDSFTFDNPISRIELVWK